MNWDDDSGWIYEDEDTRFNTNALDPDDDDDDMDKPLGGQWEDNGEEDALDPDDEDLYDDSHDELD